MENGVPGDLPSQDLGVALVCGFPSVRGSVMKQASLSINRATTADLWTGLQAALA